MKVKLNKKPLKQLSQNKAALPAEATPQVAGGTSYNTFWGTSCTTCPILV
ncbi:hypothetical protein [Pseudoalteromonas luteoviolacea]|uniref:Class I lanthipeptide n=1 Tax=Pseudoalteromonas luteoviolacea H33 TaxID=1365251 RepID=A0A167FSU4_9GAMM|nr:hypothetical protein [Pseudoalteromonas luteoviolacea]KZN52940.1 hypothetical protein N476_09150 [Pseudoalteromonas luteoviolacea H33]KZN78143.1 hypothetical protein N477_10915 [Pseudoalteromonas luteoviolacea H33-S]MBQ4875761.1 hypothetical protein [Pseudoalteromonas luteoviolacea]MBQ4904796.1 hypothetical protein [Pseudoalteromonas luteoviolacea]